MEEGSRLNQVTEQIIGAAINVHRALGPGLLESAYESCLLYELTQQGLKVEAQKPLPVVYREVKLDCGYQLEMRPCSRMELCEKLATFRIHCGLRVLRGE